MFGFPSPFGKQCGDFNIKLGHQGILPSIEQSMICHQNS